MDPDFRAAQMAQGIFAPQTVSVGDLFAGALLPGLLPGLLLVLGSLVFRGLGSDETVHGWLTALPGGAAGAMVVVMAVMFLMGFFLDFVEITLVVVPIAAPILLAMGVAPVWLGVMMAAYLQTSFLTPPFGFVLFYLRGVAPDTIRTGDIYRGAAPFVVIQIVGLLLVAAFPDLATWLPGVV